MTSWTCSFGESIHHTFDYASLCDNNAHTNMYIYIWKVMHNYIDIILLFKSI